MRFRALRALLISTLALIGAECSDGGGQGYRQGIYTDQPSKAFGQRVEYRYEFDPKKSDKPIVEVTIDDVTDESELMKLFNQRRAANPSLDVRKAPPKFDYMFGPQKRRVRGDDSGGFDDEPRFDAHRGWQNFGNMPERPQRGWHRGFADFPIHRFAGSDTQAMAEEMASFLRRQSESILAQHFPQTTKLTSPDGRFPRPDRFFVPPQFERNPPRGAFYHLKSPYSTAPNHDF